MGSPAAARQWPDMNLYADAKGPLIRELPGEPPPP